jgi:hypothetical protein
MDQPYRLQPVFTGDLLAPFFVDDQREVLFFCQYDRLGLAPVEPDHQLLYPSAVLHVHDDDFCFIDTAIEYFFGRFVYRYFLID